MNPMGNMSGNASVSSSVKTVCLFSQHTSMTDLINLSIRVKNTTCQESLSRTTGAVQSQLACTDVTVCVISDRKRV